MKVKGCNDYVQPHFGKNVEEDNGGLRIQVRIPTQLLREAVAFVNQNRNQQASQTVAENEDVTQSSNAMKEPYDQAIEETQGWKFLNKAPQFMLWKIIIKNVSLTILGATFCKTNLKSMVNVHVC